MQHVKKLLFVWLLFASFVVQADEPANYFGIDYIYRWMQGDTSITYMTQPALPANYQAGEIYYAHRFDNNVGFDIGYEQTGLKKVTNMYATNSIRLRAVQFDLLGYMSFMRHLEALGQLGFLLMQADMNAAVTASGVTSNLAPSMTFSFVPRCGFGLQYFVIKNIGVRALVSWENTRDFMLKITDADGIRRKIKPFMNSWVAGIGLVAKLK